MRPEKYKNFLWLGLHKYSDGFIRSLFYNRSRFSILKETEIELKLLEELEKELKATIDAFLLSMLSLLSKSQFCNFFPRECVWIALFLF